MVQRVRNGAARREQIRCCHYAHNVGLFWHLPSLAEVLRSLCVSSWRDLVLFSASSSFIDAPSSTWPLLSGRLLLHSHVYLLSIGEPAKLAHRSPLISPLDLCLYCTLAALSLNIRHGLRCFLNRPHRGFFHLKIFLNGNFKSNHSPVNLLDWVICIM